MTTSLLWTGWTPLLQAAVMATVGYLVLVLLLRGTGPRTMSKMTPLDFVIAVTIGSAFGGIPSSLPMPQLPEIRLDKVTTVLPSAAAFALRRRFI